MVAMRLYSEEDFHKELKETYHLSPTDEIVDDTRLWKTKNGCHVAVTELPKGESYPDYYLDIIVEHLKLLGLNYHP
jgi:hypothetical protein